MTTDNQKARELAGKVAEAIALARELDYRNRPYFEARLNDAKELIAALEARGEQIDYSKPQSQWNEATVRAAKANQDLQRRASAATTHLTADSKLVEALKRLIRAIHNEQLQFNQGIEDALINAETVLLVALASVKEKM